VVQAAVIAVMGVAVADGCFSGGGLAGFAWRRRRLILRTPGCSGIFLRSAVGSSRAEFQGTACGISEN